MVTSRTVEAVLLQPTDEAPVILRRFTRQRGDELGTKMGAAASHHPDLAEDTTVDDDFTIQFGGSQPGGTELFLSSEFAGLEGGDDASATHEPATFDLELTDILAECRDAGYADPGVAFVVSAPEYNQLELRVPVEGKKRRPERSRLLKLLTQQHEGTVDEDRVTFVALANLDESEYRFLAIFPRANDSVNATLAAMRALKDRRMPAVRLQDTEMTLFLGVVRRALRLQTEMAEISIDGGEASDESAPEPGASAGETSLIVRAGVDDTLVVFMRGETPMYIERLRSVSSLDAPETICSRILLQQDEYGIGEIHHVFVMSTDRERDLVESFQMFFPDARVDRLSDHVPSPEGGYSGEDVGRNTVAASAVAMRIVPGLRHLDAFEPVNLVLHKYTRRAPKLPFTWHVAVMSLLLFVSVAFFGFRFASQQYQIAEYEQRIRDFPTHVDTRDAQALQARIDSLRGTSQRYLHALNVLDTLMVGSDRWSRALEETAAGTSNVRGIWVESWRPIGADRVRLTGNSTSRDRVVRLAETLDGHLESLTFSDIREMQVYGFVIDIQLEDLLPEAAVYLRERALVAAEQEAAAAAEGYTGTPVSQTSY